MELDLKLALSIVLELAEQNILEPNPNESNEVDEAARQEAAIEAVRIHLEAM